MHVVTFAKVGKRVTTLENSITTTQRTIKNGTAMPHFRETSISFFSVCGYNKLNNLNEGNLVFVDAHVYVHILNLYMILFLSSLVYVQKWVKCVQIDKVNWNL